MKNEVKRRKISSQKRVARSQILLRKHNRLPGLDILAPNEVNPEPIVLHKSPPRLAHQPRPRGVLGPQALQNLQEDIRRQLVEHSGRRRRGRQLTLQLRRGNSGAGGRPRAARHRLPHLPQQPRDHSRRLVE